MAARPASISTFARLLLGADDEDLTAACHRVAHEVNRVVESRDGLLQVDDVDSVPLGEDELAHLRVPAAGLVAEMDAGLQQLFHANGRNQGSLRQYDA
jgi:hypothetical protein